MLIYAKYSFIVLIFVLIYLSIRHLLSAIIRQRKARFRLQYVQNPQIGNRINNFLTRSSSFYKHLQDLKESVEFNFSMNTFLTVSVFALYKRYCYAEYCSFKVLKV